LSKIKIAELFYSIQGEGRYMGVPSVFLRTFGCNFKCEGFGMKPGQKTEEYLNVNPEDYKTYNELPLVTTGCDSYASWDPRFKHLSPVLSSDSIAEAIMDTLPYKEWNDEHLVITGGEPLLGWQRAYPDLLDHPKMQSLKELTFETNGTQELTPEFRRYLLDWTLNPRGIVGGARGKDALTFSVSAKLPCSGESWEDAIKPSVILQYQEVGTVYLKFVIATREDAKDARRAAAEYFEAGFKGHVYLMPVGGVESVYEMNKRQVAEEAMTQGWRYSDRLQVPLFKNEWGT